MSVSSWRCYAPSLLLLGMLLFGSATAAERTSADRGPKVGEAVEFWEALRGAQIEAKLIPRDSRKATIWIENKMDKPLAIEMPLAFAGVPVLAQVGGFFAAPDPGRGGGRGGAPQRVGAPGNNFPNMNFGAGGPGGGAGHDPFARGIFNVPAGKTIKARVPCVCLDYGKRDPNPRVVYELKEIESVSDRSELPELLAVLGRGGYSQRVVQAAAWHLQDDMSWKELDALRIKHLTGRQERWFHPAELEAAKKLYENLPSIKSAPRPRDDKSDSLARR